MNTNHFLSLLLIAHAGLATQKLVGGEKQKDCCETPGAKGTTIGQTVEASASFSRNSLYQSENQFTTDTGHAFALSELRGRPVVIDMFFASCGYACPLVVTDMQAIQAKLPAAVREHSLFVLVSFDVDRDTPAVLAKYRAERALGRQWVLLQGDKDSVRELAALLGVKYKQDSDGGFSHSNLLTILNTQGEITHQRIGLQGGLNEVVAALTAASVATAK